MAAGPNEIEQVTPLHLDVEWSAGAPSPMLLQHGLRAYLILNSHLSDDDEHLVVIRFQRCVATQLGPPGDQGREEHPLWRRGLAQCEWAGEVLNSRWAGFDDEGERPRFPRPRMRHFILLLKDHTFEALSSGIEVSRFDGTRTDCITALAADLDDHP